mgnify:CR=1 FL=1
MDIAASPTVDFETFVKMLTTQLKNQDPLDPMDSANFASQLAAFSSVEQQVLTNNHLETIQTHLGSSELLQFTEWIGKFAKVTGPAHFSGTSIDIAISIPESTERADFIVKNESGSVVFRKPISNDTTEFSWGGRLPLEKLHEMQPMSSLLNHSKRMPVRVKQRCPPIRKSKRCA